ncbi:MAG: putative lipid II flippase FtsW [Candidatus Latescibacteria bacterium]|nr:putative lipid II flippase FtsW [Candidatus Latescibacterota bacterium]
MERYRIDLPLLITTLMLVGFGSVMVYSASFAMAEEMFHGESSFFLKRHLIRVVLGIGLMLFFAQFDYHKLRRWSFPLLCVSFVCLVLVFVPGLGLEIRGANRTLKLFAFNFQPAELMKLAMVLYLADSLDRRQDLIQKFVPGLLPYLVLLGLSFGLIGKQPDFGTAMVLVLTTVAVLFVGRVRLPHLIAAGLVALPLVCIKLHTTPHSRQRILSYLQNLTGNVDQGALLPGADYQLKQGLVALGSGGWSGVGLGQSRQKFLFLPDPHTDFIFAIVGEELGFIGAIAVLLLFLILAWRGIRIARRAPDLYGFLLATGITVLISTHVVLNIAVVTGLIPTTGLPLPFISYGGSWLLFSLAGIGMLLNISARSHGRRRRLQYV